MKRLVHYGMQRSGTNFLEALINGSFKARFLNRNDRRDHPLQKHFRLYADKTLIPEPQYYNDQVFSDIKEFEGALGSSPDFYLIISKDPYSWLLSYRSWAEHCNWPKMEHHHVSEYCAFYGEWLRFAKQTDRILFIRYIDLLRDQEAELARIAAIVNLRHRVFGRHLDRNVKKVRQSNTFTNGKKHYYLEAKYLESYSGGEIAEINSLLDVSLMKALGYEIMFRK